MAKNSKTENTAPVQDETVHAAEIDDDSDFITIKDDRLMYKPEECGGAKVRGYLLGTLEMQPSKANLKENPNARPWTALVIRLTRPCPVIGEDGVSIVQAPAGDEILVGGADMRAFMGHANHPDLAFEAILTPKKEVKLKGSTHRMWRYTKQINVAKPVERHGAGLLFAGKAPVALPQHHQG